MIVVVVMSRVQKISGVSVFSLLLVSCRYTDVSLTFVAGNMMGTYVGLPMTPENRKPLASA